MMGPWRWERQVGTGRHAQNDALASGRDKGEWHSQSGMSEKSVLHLDGAPSFAMRMVDLEVHRWRAMGGFDRVAMG
jgi:hypothetical protein